MKVLKDIPYSSYEVCKLDLYLPDEVKEPPVYIYIHGGGLETGYKTDVPNLFEGLLKNGVAVVSMDYRMYPTATFPDYLYDVSMAIKWVTEYGKEYGLGNIVVGGSSAGGYISMMLYFNPEYYREAGVEPTQIKGYIFDAGQPTCHYNYLKYDKREDPRRVMIDESAPLFYLVKEYENPEKEPHIMITCAELDMVNRREQLQVLHTAMLHFKFPEEKLIFKCYARETHCSYIYKDIYVQDTLEFIRKVDVM